MRYVEFHAQGLCTSTGVVEAGCKVAIGERLTQSGMHWTVRGADAIIALTMREAQRTLRRLLGTPLRSPKGCMTPAFFIFLSCTRLSDTESRNRYVSNASVPRSGMRTQSGRLISS
jgi:hypothetical protein